MPVPGDQHPWRVLATAASVSGALAVLATLLAIGYVRQKELRAAAAQESLRAQQAAAEARDAANRGRRARDQAEELAGFLLDDLRDELYQLGRSDLLVAATERTVAYFDHLPPELVTPESQAKHASVLLTLSDARYQQGNFPEAIAAARRSVALWKQVAAIADPDGERATRLGRALGELALYEYQSGDPYAARQTYSEMQKLYADPAGPIKDAGWRLHGLAKIRLGLGEIERRGKNYPDARREYTESIERITAALALKPEELAWIQMLMTAYNDLGVIGLHEKNYAAAEQSLLRSVEINRRVIRMEPKNRRWEKELATTLLNLGSLQQLQKKFTNAEPYIREALTLRQGLVNWDPKSARGLRKLAHAWHRLATLQFDTARSTEALASARNALGAFRRLLTADPDDPEATGEIQEYVEKYRDHLVKAGSPDAAQEILRETFTYAEAGHAANPDRKDWEKLLAAVRTLNAGTNTGTRP